MSQEKENAPTLIWLFDAIIYKESDAGVKDFREVNVAIDGTTEEHARRRLIKHVQRRGCWVRTANVLDVQGPANDNA